MNPYSTFYGSDRVNKMKKTPQLSPLKERRTKGKNLVKLPSVKQPNPSDTNKYNFGEIIGEGAFSKVYLARKKSDNSKCVIKIYEKSRVTTEERKRSLKREL